MVQESMGCEMEPLKEKVISTLKDVKENVCKRDGNTQELSLSLIVEKSNFKKKEEELKQEEINKRRLITLYETLNLKFANKDFWFQMDGDDNITLSWGKNQMVIRTDNCVRPELGVVCKKNHVCLHGFELFCYPVGGSYGSDTEKECKMFMKIWSKKFI